MDGQSWISERAKKLWEEAGKPTGRDLEFWTAAEYEYAHMICVASPGICPHQVTRPLSGGRNQTICVANWKECGNRASDFLPLGCLKLKPKSAA